MCQLAALKSELCRRCYGTVWQASALRRIGLSPGGLGAGRLGPRLGSPGRKGPRPCCAACCSLKLRGLPPNTRICCPYLPQVAAQPAAVHQHQHRAGPIVIPPRRAGQVRGRAADKVRQHTDAAALHQNPCRTHPTHAPALQQLWPLRRARYACTRTPHRTGAKQLVIGPISQQPRASALLQMVS